MADDDGETVVETTDDNAAVVTVEIPVESEPVIESEPASVTVVDTGDQSGAVLAEALSQLAEARSELAELRAAVTTATDTADIALATAEGTDAILAAEDDIEQSRIDAVEAELAEIATANEPEDAHPNNTHWAFRSKDEWREK